MSTIPETIYLLKQYNKWRRGDDTITMPEPFELGVAIGDAVRLLREHVTLKSKFEKLTLLAAQTADRNVEFRFRAEKAEAALANEREKSERYRLASLKLDVELVAMKARAEKSKAELADQAARFRDEIVYRQEVVRANKELDLKELARLRAEVESLHRIANAIEKAGKEQGARAEKAEADTARLDWLLARNVTISYQGANGCGVWVATYPDRAAIDTAMKENIEIPDSVSIESRNPTGGVE